VDGGIEPDRAEFFRPEVPGFLVALGRVAEGFVGAVDGRVNAIGRLRRL